ncbi:unnamed protein product [Mytilus coruscus]|uniref:Uncharacterized protein n=1 Tax=Mytilus coruscus TaxID=42192 RepID=A0A6J8BDX4_MYTCO|nr:unnamed protein product [Mytilus coruscus]
MVKGMRNRSLCPLTVDVTGCKFVIWYDNQFVYYSIKHEFTMSSPILYSVFQFKNFRTEIIPGISDHDIAHTEVNKIPAKILQKPREIPLYKKAKWENVEKDLKNVQAKIALLFKENASVEVIWELFCKTTEDSLKRNIPHKTARTKNGCPRYPSTN